MSASSGPLAGLWIGPVIFGGALFIFGILIFRFPELLSYLVALAFIAVGVGLIAMGCASKMQVTYRRIDGVERSE